MRTSVSKSPHPVEVVNCGLLEGRDGSEGGFIAEYSDGKVFRFPTSAFRFMTVTNALLTARESAWFRKYARRVKKPIPTQIPTTTTKTSNCESVSTKRRASFFPDGYDPSY